MIMCHYIRNILLFFSIAIKIFKVKHLYAVLNMTLIVVAV